MGTFWAWAYQSLVIFWRLQLTGREKIPWNRPVVLVANHRSFVDILALYKVRRPFKWVSKSENFKIPFIGMVLSLTNCVRIQRGSIRAGHQFISQAELEIKKGLLIHPTRLAVSGMPTGPGLYDLLVTLGRDTVVERMKKAVEYIQQKEK